MVQRIIFIQKFFRHLHDTHSVKSASWNCPLGTVFVAFFSALKVGITLATLPKKNNINVIRFVFFLTKCKSLRNAKQIKTKKKCV